MARYLARAGIAAAALSMLAAACGGGGGSGSTGSSSNNNAGSGGGSTTSGFNSAVNGVRNASDKKGGTLQIVSSQDVDSLDPARSYYGFVWDFQRFYERTVMALQNKTGKNTELVPDMATAPGVSSDGGKTWTYHLRTGMKFEDGTPITSKDVKYGIERVFATDVISGGPTYVITLLDDPKNPYKGPYKDTSPDKLGLKSVETPDDQTLIFHLNQPFGDFNYVMSLADTAPVPRAKDTGAKYAFKPVSSGPYKVDSYSPNKQIVLSRNQYWDQKTDPLRKALPDKINVTTNLSPDDVDNRIISNLADVDLGGGGVQVPAQAKILRDPNLKARADNPLTGAVRYITLAMNVPPLDNVHCRRAVEYAADKTTLQTARGGPVAGGDLASTMLPPVIKGYQKFDLYPSAGGKGDIAKAKQELAQCGKPNGFTTNIATVNKGKALTVATALQAGLARAGIKTQIVATDGATYYSNDVGSPSNVKRKGTGLIVAGWGADWPSGYGFFSQIIDGRNIKPQGNSNYGSYNNAQVNQWLTQAAQSTDQSQAAQLYGQIDKQVMTDAAELPFVYDKALNITSERLKNVVVGAFNGVYDFQQMGVM